MVHSAQDFTEISAEKDLKMSDTAESDLHIHPNMAKQQYHHRSQFGDTTFTKLFVGGLAWETPPEEMRKYFQQFGDILEAVIITDKNTGKSKGYGFVTFNDEESARRACDDPNPVIDGRRANCNIASLGRTRPSPPRGGRAQGGGVPVPGAGPPSVAQPPPLMYHHHHHPSYGYQTYTPDYGYHHQGTMYTPQVQVQVQQAQYYQQQVYGTSSCNSNPYYYVQAPRSAYSSPQLSPGPSYLYYPTTPMNVSFSGYPPPMRQPFPSPTPTDSQAQQRTSFESTARVVITSESSNSQGKD